MKAAALMSYELHVCLTRRREPRLRRLWRLWLVQLALGLLSNFGIKLLDPGQQAPNLRGFACSARVCRGLLKGVFITKIHKSYRSSL